MNVKDCRGEIIGALKASGSGWNATNVKNALEELAQERGIPVNFRIDEIKSGCLFGNYYPCIILSHPNPPQSYFDHMIIFNGDIISFQFWGMSKANYNANMAEYHKNSGKLSGLVKSAFYGKDEMAMQTEQAWHQEIISLYYELFEPQY